MIDFQSICHVTIIAPRYATSTRRRIMDIEEAAKHWLYEYAVRYEEDVGSTDWDVWVYDTGSDLWGP